MRPTGISAVVLFCTVLPSAAALADRDASWVGTAERARGAALPVPRFTSPSWIPAGNEPFRMVAADLNRDGNADLAVVDGRAAKVLVRFGDGRGQFGPRTALRTGRSPLGLVASDLNGDGKVDLASASRSATDSITVFINRGNRGARRFRRAGAYAAGRDAYAVAAGDVNGDGLLDLLSAHAGANHLTVLLAQRPGRFRVAHRYRGRSAYDVAVADINGDGKLDAVLAEGGNSAVSIRLGRGDGTFGDPAVYKHGSAFGVTVADLNHDAKLDILAANTPGAFVSVALGAADGGFAPVTRYSMGEDDYDYVDALLLADFDRDGQLDMATPEQPWVRRGLGNGRFGRRQRAFNGSAFMQAGAVGDFNGDGWPDLAFSEACDEVEVDCSEGPERAIAVLLNWTGRRVPPCVVPQLVLEQSPRPERSAPDPPSFAIAAQAIGTAERRAKRALVRAGCRLGRIRDGISSEGRSGQVIAQRPRPGAVRRHNSPVNLVVSRG